MNTNTKYPINFIAVLCVFRQTDGRSGKLRNS